MKLEEALEKGTERIKREAWPDKRWMNVHRGAQILEYVRFSHPIGMAVAINRDEDWEAVE